jgi:RHS repeat-associated protein
MTYGGQSQYLYDAEGRICAVESTLEPGFTTLTGYLYDADGNRVAKGTITTMSCDPTTNGFQLTENYVLGPGGEELTMIDGQGNWQRTNVYAAGLLLGTYDKVAGAPALHFHLTDPLGTRRMQLGGNLAAGLPPLGQPETDIQSLPYGDQLASYPDQYAPTSADDSTPLYYTGKERDTESGNDYFGARYYASSMGRFLSPDWSAKIEPVPYAKMDDPQSLNLYSYLKNNPLGGVDADGHCGQAEEEQCAAIQQEIINNHVDPGTALQDNQAQQQNGDPTLPTEVAEPAPSLLDQALKPSLSTAFMVATDGLGELAEAGAALLKGAEESYSVYGITEEGETTYVGITNNLERRAAEHGKDLEQIAGGLSKKEARGTEQALIEHHGLGKNGGTLTNKINSIARTNSIYTEAVTFGRQLLQSLSYLPIP